MQKASILSINYIDNEDFPAHKDLHVCVPSLSINRPADTYNFIDDDGILPGNGTDYKVRMVLKYLLEQWIVSIQNLDENETNYLPFDFADEYLGALKIKRVGNNLQVRYAASQRLSGMVPSRYNKFEILDEYFTEYGNTIEVSIQDLIEAVRTQIVVNKLDN
ncbi:hypothetical protein [Spirosoma koreense]